MSTMEINQHEISVSQRFEVQQSKNLSDRLVRHLGALTF